MSDSNDISTVDIVDNIDEIEKEPETKFKKGRPRRTQEQVKADREALKLKRLEELKTQVMPDYEKMFNEFKSKLEAEFNVQLQKINKVSESKISQIDNLAISLHEKNKADALRVIRELSGR